MAGVAGHRIIVFLQENETTDFYFPTLAAWAPPWRSLLAGC